jgi:hypothetical protein
VSTARWLDVDADFASAKQHLREAVTGYRSGKIAGPEDYWNIMAFQHAMYAGYTSFEAGLERLLRMLDEDVPVGRDWHRKLLERAAAELPGDRPAILGPQLAEAADELLRFRHVALHSYDRFTPARAEPAVLAAETFLASVDDDLQRFRSAIDPP